MAEVRFKIKGHDQETVFSSVRGNDEKLFLYAKLSDGEEVKLLLIANSENGVLQLSDYSLFEEESDVVRERLLGLSEELMNDEVQGFEPESREEGKPLPGYGPDDIFVENKPFSLRQIYDLINDGDIELSPDFQRNFIWDETRQSRLIESIFLGLPLPSIYLSQYMDGRLTIVDGLQRIMTIKRFLNNELKLSNLEYIKECNGKNYSQLKDVFSPLRLRRFGQTQIMCFVIDYRSPYKLKFDLFRRLNTGGKPLNNQEIRNCLSSRELRTALKAMVGTEAFKSATGRSVSDSRMGAQEAALRFVYFYFNYNADDDPVAFYNGNMEDTLDTAIEWLNGQEGKIQDIMPVYEQALTDAFSLFAEHTFRKVYEGQQRRSQVNKLLMLCVTVLLARYGDVYRKCIDKGRNLKNELAVLIDDDPNFFNALTWSTNSKWNIEYVFKKLKSELFDVYLK